MGQMLLNSAHCTVRIFCLAPCLFGCWLAVDHTGEPWPISCTHGVGVLLAQ